ncbi:hypothetical protein DL89DRAFT_266079 [Linderina pennispora]|uniref:Uncharacterized protein n=1 Tax=Linderina pennispora TaxID=61395 RepID=A0A1Y1WG97_9FUNG|nr:uncharacterized protein DL89DRAFT_266079 [Linderina pennispora]ORX72502.1 hypothetical protein DL89DRAFT_266079 [Linderina pennispora]
MATFNDIRGKSLERVVLHAYLGYDSLNLPSPHSHQYYLAGVCREWRRIILPRLYERAFITITSTEPSSRLPKVESNIRFVVENGLSKYTQRLSIECPCGYVASGHLVKFLDGQLFSKASWPSIYFLYILERCSSAFTTNRQLKIRTRVLDHTINPLSNLISLRMCQLSYFDIVSAPIHFVNHSFSSSLTHLTLRLSPEQTTLPYIYTPNLRKLWLLDIPPNFSWRCFYSETNSSFDFSELEEMDLHYSATSADSTIVTFSSNVIHRHTAALRKIHMPNIKLLTLSNILPSDTKLFAPHLPDVQEYSTLTEAIFSSFSAVTEVRFEVEHYIPVSINAVGWSNIRELNFFAFTSLTTLYRFISQLPLLELLRHSTSPYLLGSSKFSSNLKRLACFFHTSHFPLVYNLDPLYEFVANVVMLKEVRVPECYLQDVKDHFSQADIEEHPHVQNIRFDKVFEQFRSPQ